MVGLLPIHGFFLFDARHTQSNYKSLITKRKLASFQRQRRLLTEMLKSEKSWRWECKRDAIQHRPNRLLFLWTAQSELRAPFKAKLAGHSFTNNKILTISLRCGYKSAVGNK